METTYVELQEVPVLRVKADMKGKGPSAAFNLLESKLLTLKGRKFYGTFQFTPDGEEYYACVVRIDSDDPERMQLEAGVIPGGWYARSKLMDYRGGTSPSYLVSSKKWLALMTWTRTVHHWSFLSKPSRDAPLPPVKSHPPIEIR